MLRPEAWPFILLYALWLLWTDRSRLPWVAGGLVLLPLLLAPARVLGVGRLLARVRAREHAEPEQPRLRRAAEHRRARQLGAPAHAARVGRPRRRARPRRSATAPGARIGPMGGIALLAIAWLVLVMVMTEAGYSGNSRYLLAPTALLYVVGGVGIARLAGTLTIERPGRIAAGALAVLAVAGSVIWAAQRMPFMLRDTRFQAQVAQNLDVAISRVGGREAILACGTPFTNKFLVQLVAWKLHVHGEQVLLDPARGRHRDAPCPPRAPGAGRTAAGLPRRAPHPPLRDADRAVEDRDSVRRLTTLDPTMASATAVAEAMVGPG